MYTAHKFIGDIEKYRDKLSQSNNNQKINNKLKKKSNNKHQNKLGNLIKKSMMMEIVLNWAV